MDDKTLQALTAIAEKLGTSAEYLWGVLIKQAPISGVIDLCVMAAWVFLIAIAIHFVNQKTTSRETEDGRFHQADWSDDAAVAFAWTIVSFSALVAALFIGTSLETTISALMSPEYWALKQVIH